MGEVVQEGEEHLPLGDTLRLKRLLEHGHLALENASGIGLAMCVSVPEGVREVPSR